MASPSSPRKSASNRQQEHIEQLLQDGVILPSPNKSLLKAAEKLEKLGLISPEQTEYVLCSNPQDADFPPPNRECLGKIDISDDLDEDDCFCSDCGRAVFPLSDEKQRFSELRVRINRSGVLTYVESALQGTGAEVQMVQEGVFRVANSPFGTWLCLVDFCKDDQYLTRERAVQMPIGYLAINAKDLERRFLCEEWLKIHSLAEVISGAVNISDWMTEISTPMPPPMVMNTATPIYSRNVLPITAQPPSTNTPERRFVVECGSNVVRIENEQVMAPQSGMRYQIFMVLWERFLEDMKETVVSDAFRPFSIYDLMDEVGKRQDKYLEDETSFRRNINRLQTDLEKTIKKRLGLPIDRTDIIETCSAHGGNREHGYRLNPRTVIARPFQLN
ncbi:hypothetical protein ACQZV8_11735 [Magnetococcales bacterium HHB-1]